MTKSFFISALAALLLSFDAASQITPMTPNQKTPTRQDALDKGKPKIPNQKEVKTDKEKSLERQNAARKMSEGEIFPAKTVWINTDFPVAANTFESKITLVVISDFDCLECAYQIKELEDLYAQKPAIQIVEIVKGDSLHPISRNTILQYVQQYGFSHPIGVVVEYPEFGGIAINEIPTFLLYEKSKVPTFNTSGNIGFDSIKRRLDTVTSNLDFMNSCSTYQVQPAIQAQHWADPVIENPTYLAVNSDAGTIFVNDAAHNRIVELDASGHCVRTIGASYYGYQDEAMPNSRFDHPHGMQYFDGKLYVADTYNHRVRVVKIESDEVKTVIGNGNNSYEKKDVLVGSRDAIGLPVDIALWNGKLYVASAANNRIYELNPITGEAKKFADIPEAKDGLKRRTIKNLAESKNGLIAVLSDGSYTIIDKKGTLMSLPGAKSGEISSIVDWGGELYASTNNASQILHLVKDKWEVFAGTIQNGDTNGELTKATFNVPFDLAILNGELIITDRENHRLRKISGQKASKVIGYPIEISWDIIVDMAAHTQGEMVVMDTVFVGPKESTVQVLLDLGGYTLVSAGRNEADMNEFVGARMAVADITDNGFSFKISNKFKDYDVYTEVYLTLEDPNKPGVYLAKRAYLAFVIGRKDQAPDVQEQIYRPNLLPY